MACKFLYNGVWYEEAQLRDVWQTIRFTPPYHFGYGLAYGGEVLEMFLGGKHFLVAEGVFEIDGKPVTKEEFKEELNIAYKEVNEKNLEGTSLDGGSQSIAAGIDVDVSEEESKRTTIQLMFQATSPFIQSKASIYNQIAPNQVDATMKVINALEKTPRKVYPSNSINGFYNDLIKLGTPKAQIDLLKQHIQDKGIKEINTNDLITSLLAEMSYTVEINTATDRKKAYEAVDGEMMFLKDGWKYSNLGGEYVRRKQGEDYKYITEDLDYTQFNEAYNSLPKNPTQHYSNLTVPGGTNYTENEIATPAIIPSIKGHAAFSTNSGIGWFRTDDKQSYIEQDVDALINNMIKSGVLQKNCS